MADIMSQNQKFKSGVLMASGVGEARATPCLKSPALQLFDMGQPRCHFQLIYSIMRLVS